MKTTHFPENEEAFVHLRPWRNHSLSELPHTRYCRSWLPHVVRLCQWRDNMEPKCHTLTRRTHRTRRPPTCLHQLLRRAHNSTNRNTIPINTKVTWKRPSSKKEKLGALSHSPRFGMNTRPWMAFLRFSLPRTSWRTMATRPHRITFCKVRHDTRKSSQSLLSFCPTQVHP